MTNAILLVCLLLAVAVVGAGLLCMWAGRTVARQIEAAMKRSREMADAMDETATD